MADTESKLPEVTQPVWEGDLSTAKLAVKEHYDICSPHYQSLWGNHIHHGLWRPGNEHLSKEEAQDKLVDELLAHAKLPPNPKVLDVGCGVGGTSIRLAKLIGATCTGVTLSTTQVAMAKQNAAEAGVTDRVRFFEMDGENITLPEDGTFDAVWISEALSHFPNKDRFFANAMRMLKPGGKLVLADWFRADHISAKLSNGVIKQIEKGMLLPRLDEVSVYVSLLTTSGLRLLWLEDVSKEVAKTWDLCLDLVMRPATWAFALSLGSHIFEFAKTFKAMQEGFGNGSFRYSLMVAEKPTVADLAE